MLDCFARDGSYSPDLETALARKNDLIYGNQTLRALELLMRDRAQREQPRTQEVMYLSYRPSEIRRCCHPAADPARQ
jgi:hypothetical protein